ELIESLKQGRTDIAQGQLGVHIGDRNEILGLRPLLRGHFEVLGQLGNALGANAEPRRHLVAAKALEAVLASLNSLVDVEATDTAGRPGPEPAATIAGDQDGRPIVALDQP